MFIFLFLKNILDIYRMCKDQFLYPQQNIWVSECKHLQ
jgi:hypothetical protein